MVSYDELAKLTGVQSELLILHRFGPLAAQVLHHLQAELLELEDDMRVVREIESQDQEQLGHAKSWAKVNETIEQGGRSPRKETVEKMQQKLKEYYEFAFLTADMLKLDSPDRCDIDFLRTWLQSEKGANNFLKESQAEGNAWDSPDAQDYMALNRRSDRLAAWIANTVMPHYHRRLGHRLHKPSSKESLEPFRFWTYSEKHFTLLANLISTILSSVVPSSSIIVLYYVQSMLARLLLIIIFSSIFSLIMSFVSKGRRYEVFAATIAFAAVQVVFVGGVNVLGS